MPASLNRRALVAGAAALPAISLPAIAAPSATDPIFAAIEDHRIKNAAFNAACEQDESRESDAAVTAAGEVEWMAARTMFLTVPTTLAGIAALVSHVVECESKGREMLNINMLDKGDNEAAAVLLQTLNAALSQVVRS
jgi:hypothetical protein